MANAVGTEPGDKRRDSRSWKRIGARTVEVDAVAGSATRVAAAAGERGCPKTIGHTELAVGFIGADAAGGENRGPAADRIHEIDGGGDRAMLSSS